MIAWADGGFTPKRASTVASVSPCRNLTPTRGGSSAATGGGGLGSWSFCGGVTSGAHNTRTRVAKARPVKRAADARQRFKSDASKYFRCFITMNKSCSNPSTAIFCRGQRKIDKTSPQLRFIQSVLRPRTFGRQIFCNELSAASRGVSKNHA